nr:MAG TPA: C2H2 type zinc-finger protein [Caudoviricetes sp.]
MTERAANGRRRMILHSAEDLERHIRHTGREGKGMPKTIFDWNSRSRHVSYMCRICGKKYGSHAVAKTCEWADLKGITRKATTANKRTKERRKEYEDNIGN